MENSNGFTVENEGRATVTETASTGAHYTEEQRLAMLFADGVEHGRSVARAESFAAGEKKGKRIENDALICEILSLKSAGNETASRVVRALQDGKANRARLKAVGL